MLYYVESKFLKELILIKQSKSKECNICHYLHFLKDLSVNYMYALNALIY